MKYFSRQLALLYLTCLCMGSQAEEASLFATSEYLENPFYAKVGFDPIPDANGHHQILTIKNFMWQAQATCTYQAGVDKDEGLQTWSYDGNGWIDFDNQTWSLALSRVRTECDEYYLDFELDYSELRRIDTFTGQVSQDPTSKMTANPFYSKLR